MSVILVDLSFSIHPMKNAPFDLMLVKDAAVNAIASM
jgi:hypothetical protein